MPKDCKRQFFRILLLGVVGSLFSASIASAQAPVCSLADHIT